MTTKTTQVKGKQCYDPRTDTTVWTENVALIAADYLMDTTYGLKIPESKIDMDALEVAADSCDTSMALFRGQTREQVIKREKAEKKAEKRGSKKRSKR